MAPPTRIFQCRNGHLLCETCKSASKEKSGFDITIFTNLQDRFEPVHLSQVQTRDDWESNRHGELPQVQLYNLFPFSLLDLFSQNLFSSHTHFLFGQELAVIPSNNQWRTHLKRQYGIQYKRDFVIVLYILHLALLRV